MGRSPAKPTPWRALAEQLVDEGCESIYLTRLRAQHDVRAHVDTLAEEVAEEMARALGRTTSRVDYAFACLERDRQRAHDAAAAVLRLRVPELRDELRRHGLAVGGNKPDLAREVDARRDGGRRRGLRRAAPCVSQGAAEPAHPPPGPRLQDGQPRRGGEVHPSSSLKPLGDFLDEAPEDDDEPPVTTEQWRRGKNWAASDFFTAGALCAFQTRICEFDDGVTATPSTTRRLRPQQERAGADRDAKTGAPKKLEPLSRDRRAAGLEPLGERAVGVHGALLGGALDLPLEDARRPLRRIPLHARRRAQDDAVVRVAPQRDHDARRERLAEGRLARGRRDDHLELVRAAPQDLAPLDRRAADGVPELVHVHAARFSTRLDRFIRQQAVHVALDEGVFRGPEVDRLREGELAAEFGGRDREERMRGGAALLLQPCAQ